MRTSNENAVMNTLLKFAFIVILVAQAFASPLIAQQVQRKGDSGNQAGAIKGNATVEVAGKVITAVRTSGNTLKLIAWRKNSNGSLTRLGDSGNQAGTVGKIAATAFFGGNKLATAVQTSSKKLKIITWRVNTNGSITRLGDSGNQAGLVHSLSVAAMNNNMLVTAVRDGGGNVKLISWKVNASGSLTRLGDQTSAKGSFVRLTRLEPIGGNVQAVCAFKNTAGKLTLASYKIYPNGAIKLLKYGNAGTVKSIAIDAIRGQHVITAVKTSGNTLKMIAWQLSGYGDFYRRGDASAGAIGTLSVNTVSSSNSGAYISTAVSTSSGKLKVIMWRTNGSASTITRIGDSGNQAGTASLIRIVGTSHHKMTTAVKTGAGDLKLITWDFNAMPLP